MNTAAHNTSLLSRLLVIVLFIAILSGCGFQLRQTAVLPTSFGPVSVEGLGNYPSAYRTLRNLLKQSDIPIVAGNAAQHRILVTAHRKRKVLAVTAAGKASEYELSLSLVYSVMTPAGETLIGKRNLSSSAYYSTSASEVLKDTQQETDIFERLEQRLIDQMLNQISGIYR